MIVKRESRHYSNTARIWIGEYKNLKNLPHWHSDCEIVYVKSGKATVYLKKTAYELTENECVFIDSAVSHQIKGEKESTLSFIIFDYDIAKDIMGNKTLASPLLSNDYGFYKIFSDVKSDLATSLPLAEMSATNRIERLMIDVFIHEKVEDRTQKEDSLETRYKSLLKDIDENYANYTFGDAARFMYLSESYFSCFFKQMTDMTFTQYLNLVRIEKAIEMIRAKKRKETITEIAIKCGFGTIRTFNRVFLSITGYSPHTLPSSYTLSTHPTYEIEDTIDPTSTDSELL